MNGGYRIRMLSDASDSLQHYGIKGQKWGVRRYQNEDGTLTLAGKLRAGKEGRSMNKELKKTLADNEAYSREWRKIKKDSTKRAIKDDNYRKKVIEMEADRLKFSDKEKKDYVENTFAFDAGENAANNIMWQKYGDRSYKNIVKKQELSEKLASNLISRLEKSGKLNVKMNGIRWGNELDRSRGIEPSNKNAFEGHSAKSTLYLLQAQREIEKKKNKMKKK